MNTLMLIVLAVFALCYCGDKYCPSILKQNKQFVLGVIVGMALFSFAGLKLEGLDHEEEGDGPVYGGQVTGGRRTQTEIAQDTVATDYASCIEQMNNLFNQDLLDANQHMIMTQNCVAQYHATDGGRMEEDVAAATSRQGGSP